MSDWNKYVKQFVVNGNKVTVKKVKKANDFKQLEEVEEKSKDSQ